MTSKKDALISIVNGNTKGYIYDCVASIQEHTSGISYDILVIDNCTGDQRLHEIEDAGAKLIINKQQMGFAENHKQALDFLCVYRNLILFNDDAFLDNNAFMMMVDAADRADDIAIVGSQISGSDGALQPSAARFPDLRYFLRNTLGFDQKPGERYSDFFAKYIDYDQTQYVDWLSGCCMLIKASFVKQYGFMDTGYFMFLEDADICLRANQHNYKVNYLADAKVTHLGGGSSTDKQIGGKKTIQAKLFLETQRSRLRFLRKISIKNYFVYLLFVNLFVPLKLLKSWIKGDYSWARQLLSELAKRPLIW